MEGSPPERDVLLATKGPAGLLNPVPAQRARLLLAQGDAAGVAQWAGDCGLDPDDQLNYPNEAGHLVLARLLLTQGDAAAADALLDRLDVAAAGQQRTGSVLEIRAIRAMALAALGDEAGATAALTSALELDWPRGYVRVFADEGPAMAAVLGMLIAAQRGDQRAARIPLACGTTARTGIAVHTRTTEPEHRSSARTTAMSHCRGPDNSDATSPWFSRAGRRCHCERNAGWGWPRRSGRGHPMRRPSLRGGRNARDRT